MYAELCDHKLLVGRISAIIFRPEQTFLAQRIAKANIINHLGTEALKIFACLYILNINDFKKFRDNIYIINMRRDAKEYIRIPFSA